MYEQYRSAVNVWCVGCYHFNKGSNMTKQLLVVLFISGLLISCSQDNAVFPETYPQKWKLVKMSGSFSGSETTGDQMAWQESYLFRSGNTAMKSRTRDGQVTEIQGTYELEKKSDGAYVTITYSSSSDIIGSCTSPSQELLYFNNNAELSSTWQNCDGPGLVYERIE